MAASLRLTPKLSAIAYVQSRQNPATRPFEHLAPERSSPQSSGVTSSDLQVLDRYELAQQFRSQFFPNRLLKRPIESLKPLMYIISII